VLSWQGGERHMTDLAHMTQLLQEAAHREHFSLPALRDWLRAQRDEGAAAERFRRLDNDAAAVQVMTVFGAKGLQFPVVYLPFEFNKNVWEADLPVFHEGEQRCIYVGGSDGPGFRDIARQAKEEEASDDSRLTYVALTRAQVRLYLPLYGEKVVDSGGTYHCFHGSRNERVCSGSGWTVRSTPCAGWPIAAPAPADALGSRSRTGSSART